VHLLQRLYRDPWTVARDRHRAVTATSTVVAVDEPRTWTDDLDQARATGIDEEHVAAKIEAILKGLLES